MDKVGKVGYQNCQWSRQIWKIWKRMMVEWVDGYIIIFLFLEDAEGVWGKVLSADIELNMVLE